MIGSIAAKTDDAQGPQKQEVTPAATLKGHVNPLLQQAPPHFEKSVHCEALTRKDGEDPKPKMSAGVIGKPKDKGEAEAEGERKPKEKDKAEA